MTGAAIVATLAIGGFTSLIGRRGPSTTSWLVVIAGLAVVLVALSTIRMVADIRYNDITVRLLGVRLLDVRLDTVSAVSTVCWRQPKGLTRWVLEDVMPLGGVRITTADGRQRFVASDDPDHLAELIRSHL